MSQRTAGWLKTGLTILVSIGSMFGVGAWFVIPYRVEQLEKRQAAAEQRTVIDRELLIRIDERNQKMQDQLNRIERGIRLVKTP